MYCEICKKETNLNSLNTRLLSEVGCHICTKCKPDYKVSKEALIAAAKDCSIKFNESLMICKDCEKVRFQYCAEHRR